jgi:hypothetical protein
MGATLALGMSSGAAPAHADSVALPPKTIDRVTRDGWQVELRLERESVTSVPNLAGAPNSHEGFVTVTAVAKATGGDSPITDSILVVGYQLGCKADVSAGLQIGGTGGGIPNGDVTLAPGTNPTTNLGSAGGGAGFGQTVIQPGVIVDLPLSNMTLNDKGEAGLDVDDIHIKADACGGDVTLRSYAYLRISTQVAHTQYAIYGDPVKI